jgi:hypothetical protein
MVRNENGQIFHSLSFVGIRTPPASHFYSVGQATFLINDLHFFISSGIIRVEGGCS